MSYLTAFRFFCLTKPIENIELKTIELKTIELKTFEYRTYCK